MRIIHEEVLINRGDIGETEEWRTIYAEIHQAIASVYGLLARSNLPLTPLYTEMG